MADDTNQTQIASQTSTVGIDTGNIKNSNVNITSIIEDNTGGISATRVLMLVWGIGVFLIWGFATVMATIHGAYTGIPIPESVVTILLGVVGGKVVQRPFEK